MMQKNYFSTIEGIWKEINKIDLTPEQTSLLFSKKQEETQARTTLIQTLQNQKYTEVTPEKSQQLSVWYNTFKTNLNIEGEFELSYVDLFESPTGNFSGIIIYEEDGIRKLKRF